jgi:hypothetical protein
VISHTCTGCGYDLARTRAIRDATLDLWIVRCPRCDGAVVRRRHPTIKHWRAFLRFRTSASLLLFQVVMAAAIILAPFGAGFALPGAAEELRVDHIHEFLGNPELRDSYRGPMAIVAIGLSVVIGLAAGVWLRAGLPHWNPLLAWGAWFALLVLMVALPSILCEIDSAYESAMGRAPNRCRELQASLAIRAEYTLIVGVIGLLALPLGASWIRIRTRSRQVRWKRRLRRRRAARGRQ